MRVLFGPWMPDKADLDSSGLEDAVNCLPLAGGGYGPMRNQTIIAVSATASGGPASSGAALHDTNGTMHLFVGTEVEGAVAPRVYKVDLGNGSPSNVGRTASYTGNGPWAFTNYGNTVLAGNGADELQVYTLGSSSQFLNASASASAPLGIAFLCTSRDFVFGATAGNVVQWSQANNPLRWGANPRLQSDSQTLPDTGGIMGLTGGEFVIALTNTSVHRFTYVGSPIIWRRDEIGHGTGCRARGSVARYKNLTFFLSHAGFCLCDGMQIIPIGDGAVDHFFLNNAAASSISRLSSTVDYYNKLYIVAYRTSGSLTYNDRLLVYNIPAQRWTRADVSLRGVFGAPHMPNYNDVTASAFNVRPSRGDLGIYATSESNIVMFFHSTSELSTVKTATLVTGEARLFEDQRAFINAIRPLVQADTAPAVTARVGKRNRLDETVSYTSAVSMNVNGVCPVRADAHYHRVRVDVSGSFTQAIGFDLSPKKSGRR